MLDKASRSSLMKWNPVSDRIISARFFSKFTKLTVIQIYNPTNEVTVLSVLAGSSGGRVVKLLACGARGPGFDSRPRHLNFQRLVISCFQVEIWLKDR